VKLKYLRLKNFRRFYGEQEIEFSTDPKKTFTIIHAENGTGKSNLLNAINWCLYDEFVAGTSDPDLIINSTHKLEKSKSCSAEIKLIVEDGNRILTFIRKKKINDDSILKVYEGEDDIPVPQHEYRTKIESLIPRELSKYFFFHGEGLKTLTNDATNVKSAVQDIQGITDANEVLSEITRNKNTLAGKIKTSNKSGSKLEDLGKEIEKLEEIKQKKLNQIKEDTEKRDDINLEIDVIDKQISQSNVAAVKKNQELKTNSEKNIKDKKEQIKAHNLKRYGHAQNYYRDIMYSRMAGKCKKIINELQDGGKFPADLSDNLIQQIFEKQECICGTCIKIGTDEYKKLESWLTKAADAKYTADVLNLENQHPATLKNSKIFIDSTADHEQIKAQLEADLAQQQRTFDDASEALSGMKEDNVDELSAQREKLVKKRNELNEDIETMNTSVRLHIQNLSPKQRDYEIELKKSKVDPALKNRYEFLKVAEERLEKMLSSYEVTAKSFVKDRINEYFQKFATKDFKVEFNSEFLPSLLEKNIKDSYTKAPESSGENLLKNIAFVCSLMEFSAQRADKKNTSFQIEGVKSPFVIDAPFGDTDGRYSNALARILANCQAEQIIIFLSKKHYKGSFESITEDKKLVGSRYIIDNYATNTEKEKFDSDEDNAEIEINGKKYKQMHAHKKDFGYSNLRQIKI